MANQRTVENKIKQMTVMQKIVSIFNEKIATFVSSNCSKNDQFILLVSFSQKPELMENFGYNSETHSVTTEDGYILTVFRIIKNKTEKIERRPVVLFLHGFGNSSDLWVICGPKASLSMQAYYILKFQRNLKLKFLLSSAVLVKDSRKILFNKHLKKSSYKNVKNNFFQHFFSKKLVTTYG